LMVIEGLLNRVSTQTERTRLLEAFGSAEEMLSELRGYVIARVRDRETVTAVAATVEQIKTDFAETP
jgi:hypothetical protein